jgi:Flp pilus assembly protein TadG
MRRDERGSAAVEMALLVLPVMTIVMLAVAGGRIALAQGSVQQAATDAARAVSVARTQDAAQADAQAAAAATLSAEGLSCDSTQVDIDVSGFAVPVGTPAQVSATVTCVVRLADLGVGALPGSHSVTATVISPLDTYRGRS